MDGLRRVILASGLPQCWSVEFDALRPVEERELAVRHTARSLARMPAGYRWGMTVALRFFPAAFWAVTRRLPNGADDLTARRGMERLRRAPGYGELLRATTPLALFGALDGRSRTLQGAKTRTPVASSVRGAR